MKVNYAEGQTDTTFTSYAKKYKEVVEFLDPD
jgi:hypothetical protein